MNPLVDLYLADGCGRCKYYKTLQCKVHKWTDELVQLRRIVLECGLDEKLKWSMPCYTVDGKNILIITAFKNFAAINFMKGSLLKDELHLLEKAGGNSHVASQLRFTDVKKILDIETEIKACIYEAIAIEKSGQKVVKKKVSDYNVPAELKQKFVENPSLEAAFKALTPGRQRAYLLFFSDAKQSTTRTKRIEKYMEKILMGMGFND